MRAELITSSTHAQNRRDEKNIKYCHVTLELNSTKKKTNIAIDFEAQYTRTVEVAQKNTDRMRMYGYDWRGDHERQYRWNGGTRPRLHKIIINYRIFYSFLSKKNQDLNQNWFSNRPRPGGEEQMRKRKETNEKREQVTNLQKKTQCSE